MTDLLLKWGVAVVAGFLAGLVIAAWLNPQTIGGFALILLTVMAAAILISAVGSLIRSLLRGRAAKARRDQIAQAMNSAAFSPAPSISGSQQPTPSDANSTLAPPADIKPSPQASGPTAGTF